MKFTLINARDVNSRMSICTHVYHTHLVYGVNLKLFFLVNINNNKICVTLWTIDFSSICDKNRKTGMKKAK